MKICFIDVETTGLYASRNALLQVAGIIRIDGKIKKKFDFKMQPFADAVIDVNSEMATKHRLKDATAFKKFKKVLEDYINPYNKKDKFYFIGYNASFDESFIRAWFLRNEDKYYGSYFWNPSVDLMQMIARALMRRDKRHELKNMKLGTVAKYHGIKVKDDNLHDAAYDIKITKDLYNIACKRYKV